MSGQLGNDEVGPDGAYRVAYLKVALLFWFLVAVIEFEPTTFSL